MPIDRQTSGNEPFSYDMCPEFSGGMASAPRANLLNQNQAAYLQNFEFDTQGIMRTRRGTRQFQSTSSPGYLGGITVNLPNNKVITVVSGGGIQFCLAPNVTSTPSGGNGAGSNHTGLTGVASTDIITDNAHGYADGTRVAFTSITANHTGITGVAATDIVTDNAHGYANNTLVAFSAIVGGAGLIAGSYYYVITATANTYQLSLTPGGAAVNFTTDITSGTLTSVGSFSGFALGIGYFIVNSTANTYQLSLSIGGTAIDFYTSITAATISALGLFAPGAFVATAHGETGAYYADGQNFVAFCDGLTVVQNTSIPICSLMAWHTKALFVAGIPGRPNTIKRSGILNDRLWLSAFSIDVGTNDGDRIVAILPYQDNFLVVFKRNSIWLVNADPTATNEQGQLSANGWIVQRITGTLGCVASRTPANVADNVWFMSQDGVRVITRAPSVNNQFDIVEPVSAPLRDYMRRFNRSAPENTACSIVFEGMYLLSLPIDGDVVNSLTLVAREITNSWMGVWTLQIQNFIIDTIYQPQRLLMATTDFLLREWLNYYQDFTADPSCFQDLGVGVACQLRTRAMIFGEIVSGKAMQTWGGEYYNSRSAATTISASVDSGTDVALLTIDTERNPALFFPIALPSTMPVSGVKRRGSNLRSVGDGREIQLVMANTDLLPVSFRYFGAGASIQPVQFETN